MSPQDAKSVEPFAACLDTIMREWKLAEYRAEFWGASGPVVAPSCTAASTSGFVHELSAGNTCNQDNAAVRAASATGSSLIAPASQEIGHIRDVE